MAVFYVYSGAAGTADGSSWANAKTTVGVTVNSAAAGDTVFVAHDHSETTAGSVTISGNGSIAAPVKVVCVNRAGSVPPVSADRRTTAQVANSGNNFFNFGGVVHYDGIIFVAGNSTGAAIYNLPSVDSMSVRFDNCSLRLGSTGASTIRIPSSGGFGGPYVEFNNTTVSFSAINQFIDVAGVLKWRNTASALIGAAVPTTLFVPRAASGGEVECAGVDLSAAASGKTLVGASATAIAMKFRFIDCKLNAAVTRSAAPSALGATEIDFIRSGSAGVNYTVFRHRMTGTLDQETTIVRSGGASDGTTPISWKIVTSANCGYSLPFECPPIAIWNDVIGSVVTATVEGIWGGGAVPNDDDVWLDVEYLGDASSPQASFVNDGKADLLATAAGQTSSSVTWGGSTTKFKLNVSFTAQQKGWIYARVKCAKASSTFYVDPLVTLT